LLVAAKGTAVQRPLPSGGIAGSLVELELQYSDEEIAGIKRVARNVIFCFRVKSIGGPLNPWCDTLMLQLQAMRSNSRLD